MITPLKTFILSAICFILCFGGSAIAQEVDADAAASAEITQQQAAPTEVEVTPAVKETSRPDVMTSILFTRWEHSAIADAKRARGLARPPSEAELARELGANRQIERIKPPPEEREITLGGIVFVRGNDWTIWLNGKRVTPNALPEEIIDLKVYGEYIELKWYDDWTNQIFPLRMRPHQRFNIDTRIFLPG